EMSEETARPYVALPGSARQPIPGAQQIGPSDPAQVITVTIRLRSRAPSGQLTAQVDAMGAQPPAERTYLTPEQYEATYGADPAQMERVEQFARDNQLTVVKSDPALRTVVLSGTIAAFSQAFHVQLMQYSSPRGTYRGRVGPVQVPDDLQQAIEGIFGLD